ncbi:MAG: phage major capsid protein [Gammaproteobacteria bacterium PRO9]|nr:phage major capsid protein [Gammaproteobacteria bacterium PRO9]
MELPDFDLGLAIASLAAGTYRKATTDERSTSEYLERKYGQPQGDPNFSIKIPRRALLSRDLTAGIANAGGFLVDNRVQPYAPTLLPKSVVLRAGARLVPVSGGNLSTPVGAGSASTTWLQAENTTIPESTPVLSTVAATPKTLAVFVEVSRQLLLQSNAGDIVRREITNAAAAELDRAVIAGSGAAGEPLGIIGTPGIGSVTGTTLSHAGLMELQQGILDANAGENPSSCAYVTTPTVAKLLNSRQRFTGSDTPLWQGALGEGLVGGARAFSTRNAPAASVLYGDFSEVTILQWDTAELMADPYTQMQQAIIGIRLMLSVDVVVRHAAAFSLATGVT